MSAPKTGREFVELLHKSQLLASDILDQLQPQLAKYAHIDPQRLAKTLVRHQLLSEHQARNLLSGRYQGFYIGKYRILQLLGKGGMGKVYLAEQLSMERLVAVKVIHQLDRKGRRGETLARFRREAKAVAALSHPNIVRAYDFEEQGGSPYIVMEFVEGIDLASLVSKIGRIPPAFAADIMRQAAAGLHDAHKAGMVHRDIKPGNLLIDAQGGVHILDLGLCSLQSGENDSLTVDQDQLGTVDYIAPEQSVNSHTVDHRADLYGLAATIYSVMRADVMYPGYTSTQKLIAHQNEMPRPIEEIVSDVPEGFARLIQRMLAKNPDDRPASAVTVFNECKEWAKRPQPPFDPALIPHRKKKFEGLLGKGPDPADMNSSNHVVLSDSSASIAASSDVIASQSKIFQEPLIEEHFGGEDQMTRLQLPPRKPKRKKKKKRQSFDITPLLWGVGGVAAVLVLSTVVLNSPLFSKADPEPVPAVATVEEQPLTTQLPLSITEVANTNSTRPMFYNQDGERLELKEWGSRTVNNIRFELVDPTQGDQNNLIQLYGKEGNVPPKKPTSIRVPCQHRADRIHLLSGVGGWAYPMDQSVSEVLRVRLHLKGGGAEDHPLLNSIHFADYIKRHDVPQSQFAFEISGHQMRYLTIIPRSQDVITEIEFIKGAAEIVSPLIMAITLEVPK